MEQDSVTFDKYKNRGVQTVDNFPIRITGNMKEV